MVVFVLLFMIAFALVGNKVRESLNEEVERDVKDRNQSRDARGSRIDADRSGGNGTSGSAVAVQERRRSIVHPDFMSECHSTDPDVETYGSEIVPPCDAELTHPPMQMQPACAESPDSIMPQEVSSTDETPTLATKSTVVLLQAAKTEIDKECGTFAFVGNNVRVAVNEGVERDIKDIDDTREARGSRFDAGRICGNGTGDSAVTVHARRHSIVNSDFVSESDSISSDVETRDSEALMVAYRDAELLQSPKQKYQQKQEQEQHDQGQKLCVLDCIGRQSAAEDAASGIGVHTEARVTTTHLVEGTPKDEVSVVDGRDRCADSNSPTKNKVRAKKNKSTKNKSMKKKSTKKTKTKNVN
jgi:hypothetical protein